MESVARINRLFGSGGEVMISLYESFPSSFESSKPLFARVDGLFVPLYVSKFERRGRAGAIIAFDDIDTERRVEEFLNLELYMPDSGEEYDGDEEFTLDELIGFTVELIDGESILKGEISDFIDSEDNPLFEVAVGENNHLIPAVEEFILAIDFDGRSMRLAPPSGLLEL